METIDEAQEPQEPLVVGVFDTEAAAARATEALIGVGFDPARDLSVVVAHQRQHEEVSVPYRDGIAAGAGIGSALGAVLGAVGAVLVATGVVVAGPVEMLAAGPVLAAIQGGGAGGAAGYAFGVLMGMERWKQEPDFKHAHVHPGVVWIGVHATGARAELAHRILAEAGARHFEGRPS